MDKQIKKDNLIFIFLAVVCILMFYFVRMLGLLFVLGFILFLLFKKQWKFLSGIFLFLLINLVLSALIDYSTLSSVMIIRSLCFWGSLSFVLLIYKQYIWMVMALAVGMIVFVLTDYNKYDRADYYQITKTNNR